ncbi:MAG TPA: DUF4920 domain-containing protein [Flavobacteriaceae bacterium]|nr:DUF4920 domain-containing protein [Flavobacteriaceae bacterium]
MKKTVLLTFALFSFIALMAQPPAGEANKGDTYGDASAINDNNEITKIAQIKKGEVLEGNFIGNVEEVCAKKGCWVQLVLADGTPASVKMKDYGFFVPTALVGKEVVIQGKAELKTTSVAELQHLAEDAGKSQEEIDAITEPEEVISIMADGIKVKG